MPPCTRPERGKVLLNGDEIKSDKDARRARQELGNLAQSFGYPKNFTALEFVLYCLWLRGKANPEPKEALSALKLTGMDESAKTKMKSLSGGMRQRVGISSAIAGASKLVLLDEPTVGLDPAQRLQFRKLIRSLSEQSCIVLSAHLIEDVAAACDSVAVMADGRVKFSGTPHQLEKLASADSAGDSALEKGYMSVLGLGGDW